MEFIRQIIQTLSFVLFYCCYKRRRHCWTNIFLMFYLLTTMIVETTIQLPYLFSTTGSCNFQRMVLSNKSSKTASATTVVFDYSEAPSFVERLTHKICSNIIFYQFQFPIICCTTRAPFTVLAFVFSGIIHPNLLKLSRTTRTNRTHF